MSSKQHLEMIKTAKWAGYLSRSLYMDGSLLCETWAEALEKKWSDKLCMLNMMVNVLLEQF